MRKQKRLVPCLVLIVLLGLIAVAALVGYFYFLQPTRSTLPVVLIRSPRNGEELQVGQETIIHSIARSESKVTRVELWIDGQIQESEASSLPGGTSPFPLVTRWQPTAPGNHTLTVRAFNSGGGRAHASISVIATQLPDADNDEVPDASDACPEQPGAQAAEGCADRDGDGIPDIQDQCPAESGVPANGGCPMISEGDRDGDGLVDSADACPEQVGAPYADGCPDRDSDGIQDSQDACPDEVGLPSGEGCPTPGDADSDGVADAVDECPTGPGSADTAGCVDEDDDGVRDDADACPGEAGNPALGGCPDRDGDTVADSEDLCPDVAGPASNGGCPMVSVSDRDRDGLTDDIDRCPDEPGLPEHAGCPPPGGGADGDGDDIPDDAEPPDDSVADDAGSSFGPFDAQFLVEFEALEFHVNGDYTEVYCYASLADGAPERYPAEGSLDAAGTRVWDIAEQLGGANTRRVGIGVGDPLGVSIECAADYIVYEEDGAWGSHFDLGSIATRHPVSDFDGHVITTYSTGGPDGRGFEVRYRICPLSCESAEFRPPVVYGPYYFLADYLMYWEWEGDRTAISGFRLYVNGNGVGFIGPDRMDISIAHFMPPCEERHTYQLSAYRLDADGTIRESPRSNEIEWTGFGCPRTARVTFDRFITGGDWGGEDEPLVQSETFWGPIEGSFAANDLSIDFDFASKGWFWWVPYATGLDLGLNTDYDVTDLFADAESVYEFSAPATDTLTVNLGPYDDLTIGGQIADVDALTDSETIFSAHRTLQAEDLRSGEYRLVNRNVMLVIQVEVTEGE
jgi:hypothetical protein